MYVQLASAILAIFMSFCPRYDPDVEHMVYKINFPRLVGHCKPVLPMIIQDNMLRIVENVCREPHTVVGRGFPSEASINQQIH
jgi:hypothetical protein